VRRPGPARAAGSGAGPTAGGEEPAAPRRFRGGPAGCRGQRPAAGQALEQAQAKARFQPAYLLRNSGLGHAQLLGRQPKVQVAGDHFKNT